MYLSYNLFLNTAVKRCGHITVLGLIALAIGSCDAQQHVSETNGNEVSKNRLLFDVTIGQSLGTNRVGPAANGEEAWTAIDDYADADLNGIFSFDRVFAPGNKQDGIDVYLENISTQTFQPVKSEAYGASITRGNVASNSPFISSALSYQTSDEQTDVHLSSLAMGGQELSFFLPNADLIREGTELTNWWNGAFLPSLDAFRDNAAQTAYGDIDTHFKWLQGEADHGKANTREEYRYALKNFHLSILDAYASVFGEIDLEKPLFLSYQMGRIYAPHRQNYGKNSGPYRISEITLGTLDLGLSDAPELENFISIPPSYAYSFSGISHMDQAGYHALQSMFGYVAAEAEQSRKNRVKWKPLHVLPSSKIADGNQKVELNFHIPIEGAELKIGIPDDSTYFSVPNKPDAGISLHCDGTSPDIEQVTIETGVPTIVIELSAPWICKQRKVGIAYQGQNSYYQGWQRRGGLPTGEPYHKGLGTNIYIETNWVEPSSGRKHTIYASHQLIDIDPTD